MLPPDFYGCGSCLSRLRIGESGSLTNTGDSSCLWLLHTEHTGARIRLQCHNIQLPSCRVRFSEDDIEYPNYLIRAVTPVELSLILTMLWWSLRTGTSPGLTCTVAMRLGDTWSTCQHAGGWRCLTFTWTHQSRVSSHVNTVSYHMITELYWWTSLMFGRLI